MIDRNERQRGYNDAKAGHGPVLFDGPYMIGYRRGRAEIGLPMEHKPAKEEGPRTLDLPTHACPECGRRHMTPADNERVNAHHRTCVHCALPVFYDYLLKSDVWAATGLGYHDGVLHLPCVEARIGRRLSLADFEDSCAKQGQSINDGIRWAFAAASEKT